MVTLSPERQPGEEGESGLHGLFPLGNVFYIISGDQHKS